MLEWADVWKILLGFTSSVGLIWTKELVVHRRRLGGMRKSLWSMMEFESDLEAFMGAVERIKESVADGNLRLVAFDIPRGITSAADELARLEPQSAYIYNDLQSAAEIVRTGIAFLRDLTKHLSTMKPSDEDEVRLRRAIRGQASILKGDRLNLAAAELRVLKHLRTRQGKFSQSTIDRVESAVGKFTKDDYESLFEEPEKGEIGAEAR